MAVERVSESRRAGSRTRARPTHNSTRRSRKDDRDIAATAIARVLFVVRETRRAPSCAPDPSAPDRYATSARRLCEPYPQLDRAYTVRIIDWQTWHIELC